MASGHVSRTDRPNTWLLRPALRRDQSLDNPEPSTHGPPQTLRLASALAKWGEAAVRQGGIAGSDRMSQHAMGNAMDIGSQTDRNVIARDSRAWIESHPKEWRSALNKWGMVSGGDWRNPDLGHVEWSGKTPWKSQGTAVASVPKTGSHEFWSQGKAKAGEPQVAAKAPERADPTPRPRSEPQAPPQVADAGPRPGTQEYWRGPKHGEEAAEATRVAEARRSRGHAAGEADAQSHLPYAGSAEPSTASSPTPSVASVDYEGGGAVPSKITINITVAARV